MAAAPTVPELSPSPKLTHEWPPLRPMRGVVTLFGYGVRVRMERGHLLVEDGIGPTRRRTRFPRVGHGLRRMVVTGSDGLVSLAALRWLVDQKVGFVML